MKKLIVLVLATALLLGCATTRTVQERNPPLEDFERWSAGLLGAGGGYLLAKSLGANEWIQGGAAAAGWITANKAVRAAQWDDTESYRPSPSVVVVQPGTPYGYGAYGGHYDQYGRVYGAYGPSVYGYDPRSYRRWGGTDGYCHGGDGRIIPCPSAYTTVPQSSITVINLPKSSGPTVDNYRDNPMIHTDCKTGNWGADGKCLIRLAPTLAGEQKICEADPKDSRCPKGYNPGKWAQIYRRLGGELIARQRE